MATPDFYEVLGIERNADSDDIRNAYRRLAMRYHPDRNPDNEEAADRFKQISEAYAVLSDPEKKQRYDTGGYDFAGAGNGAGGFQEVDLGDLFGEFFGGSAFRDAFGGGGFQRRGRTRNGPMPGSDLEYALEIDLEEAVGGCSREISFTGPVACDDCEGRGHEADGGLQQCPQCDGTGQIGDRRGAVFVGQTCNRCGGAGSTFSKPCKTCGGRGFSNKDRTVKVDIPPGIDYGQSLRLSGQGGVGRGGGRPGDLFVRIQVREHELFERDGRNLIVRLPLSFAQAALGDEVRIEAPGGTIMVKVPAGIQSGQVLRVAGQGVVALGRSDRGDLLCHVQVQTPTGLDQKQQERLRDFDQSLPEDSAAKKVFDRIGSFFKRVRG